MKTAGVSRGTKQAMLATDENGGLRLTQNKGWILKNDSIMIHDNKTRVRAARIKIIGMLAAERKPG